MKNSIEKIFDKNLRNKQLIDLAVNMLDTTSTLYAKDSPYAFYGLLQEGGPSTLKDNLQNVSNSMDEVDSNLVDLQEDDNVGQLPKNLIYKGK